jgi:CO/xanthine dehydrogenase Mo-binding subunit
MSVSLDNGPGADLAPSRRGFLITVTAAGAMFSATAPAHAADSFAPTIWYDIDRAGTITVHIIRAEMGQHVGTAIARIVADELEADWSKVRIDHVDSDPKWGLMATGGSWSIWQSYPLYSQAAAAGRIALIEAGARLLGVPASACVARNSAVVAGKASVSYGDIIVRGDLSRKFTEAELAKLPIKTPAQRKLIGKPAPARDIPDKTNGKGVYGLDAKVPGMVYARPKLPPTRYGSTVASIDESAAKAVPGYIRAIALDDPSGTVPGWVMVYADSFAAADRATEALKVTWTSPDAIKVSEADLQARARALVADKTKGSLAVEDPGVDAAFKAATSTLEQTYTTATACTSSWSRSMRWPSRRTGSSRSTPATSGNPWFCPGWPRRWGARRTPLSCAPICWVAVSDGG